MATNPLQLGLDPRLANYIDPMSSAFFGTAGNGEQTQSLGDGFGNVLDWSQYGGLGYDTSSFYGSNGDNESPTMGVTSPQAAQQWLQSNGLRIANQYLPDGRFANYLLDAQGQVVGEPFIGTQNDPNFWGAAMLAGAAVTAGVGTGYLGGGAAAAGTGGIPLTAAEMGVGSFPAGMEGFGFANATGAGAGAAGSGTIAGGGMAAGANALYAPAGFAGGTGSALAGGTAAAGAGGLGGFLSSLGSANSLANLGSAAIGLYGQNQALGAMEDATNQSNEFNRYAFDTIRADNKPLVDMRNSVLPQIQGLLSNPGSITSTPGYKFEFDQGNKSLQNGAAGRGMTYSGAQGKALQRYGQDFASTKLDQSLNRLTTVAGLGQVGSNSNNNATQSYAANGANNALNQGQARGSVYGNMANIGGNALSSIFNNWQYGNINGGP